MDKRSATPSSAQDIATNSDSKLSAAADFSARLLNSPVGNSIARIVLFGSVADNQAHPNSDVDVMVFGAAPRRILQEYTAQAAWEATAEGGEQVAQLSFGLDELFQPRSYLVYRALREGKEVYCMEEHEARQLEATNLQQKAQRHFEQARRASSREDFELAVVGAYTACELAAKALVLLKFDVELPTTHGGMLRIFSQEYVKTGEAPETWGRMLNRGLEARSHALYATTITVDHDDVQPMLELAQEMLAFLKQKLNAG